MFLHKSDQQIWEAYAAPPTDPNAGDSQARHHDLLAKAAAVNSGQQKPSTAMPAILQKLKDRYDWGEDDGEENKTYTYNQLKQFCSELQRPLTVLRQEIHKAWAKARATEGYTETSDDDGKPTEQWYMSDVGQEIAGALEEMEHDIENAHEAVMDVVNGIPDQYEEWPEQK